MKHIVLAAVFLIALISLLLQLSFQRRQAIQNLVQVIERQHEAFALIQKALESSGQSQTRCAIFEGMLYKDSTTGISYVHDGGNWLEIADPNEVKE